VVVSDIDRCQETIQETFQCEDEDKDFKWQQWAVVAVALLRPRLQTCQQLQGDGHN